MSGAQAAEAQARLNVCLREIVTFFEEAGSQDHSISLLNSFIDKHLTTDFLSLAEGFGSCMAFIDHNELISKLYRTVCTLIDGYVIERKIITKKIRLLKEDKKSDPDVLARQENLLADVDSKKANAMVQMARLRAMNAVPMSMFEDDNFNAFVHYKQLLEHQKALLKTASIKSKA